MHTFNTEKAPRYIAHHNGDFSGDVILIQFKNADPVAEITIPFVFLKELVAQYVLHDRMLKLEHATADELLGIPEGP